MNGTLGSLFTGCGGLDRGLENGAGLRSIWHAQHDPAARKQPCNEILARHWPGIPNLGDITRIDWTDVEPPDVLAGGFPCQDVSHAGLRAGLAHGTRSGLWFEFARAVRLLRPRIVVVENVPGLLTAGFGLVMADLAEAGYDTSWCCFRAADVGAPHGRERIFVVAADADTQRGKRWAQQRAGAQGRRPESSRGYTAAADAGRERSHGPGEGDARAAPGARDGRLEFARPAEAAADADVSSGEVRLDAGRDGGRARLQPVGSTSPAADTGCARLKGAAHGGPGGRPGSLGAGEAAADTGREPGEPRGGRRAAGGADARADAAERDGDRHSRPTERGAAVEWGVYGDAVRRWEGILGRAAPAPIDDRGRLAPEFVEWMLGFPADWTAGVSRTARLKMLGNAVQVQCAEVVGIAVAEIAAA